MTDQQPLSDFQSVIWNQRDSLACNLGELLELSDETLLSSEVLLKSICTLISKVDLLRTRYFARKDGSGYCRVMSDLSEKDHVDFTFAYKNEDEFYERY